jgi:hypothetical protein
MVTGCDSHAYAATHAARFREGIMCARRTRPWGGHKDSLPPLLPTAAAAFALQCPVAGGAVLRLLLLRHDAPRCHSMLLCSESP